MPDTYQPPYRITTAILNRVGSISESIGRLTVLSEQSKALRLRRINRIRTIQGSLAIEGNTLSEAQITAILDGKRVIAPPREVLEVTNALAAYDRFDTWRSDAEKDLLEAQLLLMAGLIDGAGKYRRRAVGWSLSRVRCHRRLAQLRWNLYIRNSIPFPIEFAKSC